MAVQPISYLPPVSGIAAGAAAPTQPAGDFGAWMTRALGDVNGQLAQADASLRSLASGETENLHQVMISLEEARLNLQLVVQVRNRLLEAYQEILRMQV